MPENAFARRAAYLRTVRREKRRVRIWQIALVAVLFAVWELSCRLGLSDGFLVSSPSRMVQTLWRLCASGELWHHAAVSIGETVLGFTAGTVLGTAVAVAMWWSDTAARILDPYLVVLNALPKTALGPIFIVWMGAGMGAIVTMTLAISLIVTILSMYTGFRTTDPEKLRLMRTLGADKRQILWLLVFPANCPTLFSTLKVNVGLSWVGGHHGRVPGIPGRAGVSHRLRLPGVQHGPGHGQRAGAGAGGGGNVPAGAAGRSILKSSMGYVHEKATYLHLYGRAAVAQPADRLRRGDRYRRYRRHGGEKRHGPAQRGDALGVLRTAVRGYEPGFFADEGWTLN